jgi:cytochrome c peroxidase
LKLQATILVVMIFMIVLAGSALAAALVGDSYRIPHFAVSNPILDQVKAAYRRPDTIPFPPTNTYTPAKALLGRMLFNDPRLSDTGALSCASCHNPGFAYGDGLTKASGRGHRPLARRSPSIINSAWGDRFPWDGNAASLEDQALGPVRNPAIMNLPPDRMIEILSRLDGYKTLFANAFPNQPLTPRIVAEAIATHERTIVSGYSSFDAWIDGNEAAIGEAAKRGFDLFNTKARCAGCHAGWNFTDNGFHDIGLPDQDEGRGRIMPQVVKMHHAFKTPSLRETQHRGPYMHDGSLPTLEAVVGRYNEGGADRPSQSELIEPLGLSPDEQLDIVAFLRTLTSPMEPDFVSAFPR